MEDFIQISEGLRDLENMYSRSQSSPGTHERAVYEIVRAKLKVQWRLWEVGDGRNMEHLQRKTPSGKHNQSNREAMGLQPASHGGMAARALLSSHLITIYPGSWTWSFRN